MLPTDGFGDVPLRADAWICQAPEEMLKCLPVTRKGRSFIRSRRLEDRNELGKLGVRESGMPVMDTMKGFVQQCKRYQFAQPSLGDDAPC